MDNWLKVVPCNPPPRIPVDIPPMSILFLGNENIGKTKFIKTYCDHLSTHYRITTFYGRYMIFRQYQFVKERRERFYAFRLLDLPAGITAERRRGQYPLMVDMVALCFAVDVPSSLDNVLDPWRQEVQDHYADPPRFHLLGLRNDLREDEQYRENREPVPLLTALDFHDRNGFSRDYNETSALRDPEHATFVMDSLIYHVFAYRQLH